MDPAPGEWTSPGTRSGRWLAAPGAADPSAVVAPPSGDGGCGDARRGRPRQAYRSSDSTDADVWFACARAAMPLWLRMLNRVMLAVSSAMFASRMRLSAALLLTTCDCASEIANCRRFCSTPIVLCAWPSSVTAEATAATAASASVCVVSAVPLRLRLATEAPAMVPVILPLAPLLLTNTEKPVLDWSPA